ncbi:MAG TPA: PQQ-binding-like beta-propeller repeat protein, partial [bacterium]|nr:PQQ-binding-like beta-propeller repeat protein [bacterium]
MRTALLLVLAALVGMSTGCSKPVTGPSFHAPKGTSYFGDITQPFSFTVASPVLVDPGKGTAFFVVAALDGQFYAFDRDQGKRIGRKAWARLPKGVRGTPFADQVNRQLLVGCYDKAVYALDMGTGAPRWRAQVDGYVQAPVALVGAAAVVGTSVGSLYGLSPLDGSELWRIPLGNGIFAEAGVHPSWPSRALVGTSGGKCAVIDTALGKVLSEFQVNGGLESGPSVAEIDG